jgi:YjbE family integral membrane protein
MMNWIGPILGIVLVDLVLSGDNAVVIGAAAAALPPRQRLWTIIAGGGGAILLRLLFAAAASFLLQVPYLGILGALILLIIAVLLLADRGKITHHSSTARPAQTEAPKMGIKGILMPIFTILVADAAMSLDNVLAIAGLAVGNLPLLVIGLMISILLLLLGSALIASLIGRLPWLLDVACVVIGWAAANVFLSDDALQSLLRQFSAVTILVYAIATIVVLAADLILFKRHKNSGEEAR